MPSATPAELYRTQSCLQPTRPSKPVCRSSSSQTAEQGTTKVVGWLSTQKPTSSSQLIPMSPSSSPDGGKVVHWTGDVVDNSKPTRTSKSSSSKSKSSSSPSSSSSSKRKSEKSDESRQSPSAPRPHRLPSPDLSDFQCDDFCDCYSCQPKMMSREEIMSRQLEVARRYISDAKRRGH